MKLIETYYYKTPELWLQQNYDDVHNEVIDNTPKVAFVLAADWCTINQRPRHVRRGSTEVPPDQDYYSYLYCKLYLGYYQFVLTLRLKKLPYRNILQWREWKSNEKS